MNCSPPVSSVHEHSPGKNTGMGCPALFQRIFPTQGSNPGLVHCRQILYHLSHQGSPRTLHWVAYPFSRGSSPPRNQTGVSCIGGGFFTSWATRKALYSLEYWWIKFCCAWKSSGCRVCYLFRLILCLLPRTFTEFLNSCDFVESTVWTMFLVKKTQF